MSKIFIDKLESTYRSGELLQLVANTTSLVSITNTLGYSSHGRYTKMLRDFCISCGIDISHFSPNGRALLAILEKKCPQCGISFTCKSYGEKETCSHACANIYFAYKQGTKNRVNGTGAYVSDLTKYYKNNTITIKCCACEETDILDVHHVDEDRYNNKIDNLVFLCPTHHAKYHRNKDDYTISMIVAELDSRPLVK